MIYEYFRSKLKEAIFQIPQPIPPDSYEDAIPLEKDKPFNTLLTKEIQRYNALLTRIRTNLDNTFAAMEGLRQHAEDTDVTFECLQQDRTPPLWSKSCYPCHSSMSKFVENLVVRVDYIKALLDMAANDKFASRRFWFPGFFSQRNFLMTLMQEVSRKQRITIEALVINFRIMAGGERMYSQIKAEGTNSYYIEGLWLYGADWLEGEQTIVDLPPQAPNGQALPMIHLMVTQQSVEGDSEASQVDHGGPEGNLVVPDYLSNEEYQLHHFAKTHYMCPVYVNFELNRIEAINSAEGMRITTIPIPVKHRKPNFWIKRNVCLLCYNESSTE